MVLAVNGNDGVPRLVTSPCESVSDGWLVAVPFSSALSGIVGASGQVSGVVLKAGSGDPEFDTFRGIATEEPGHGDDGPNLIAPVDVAEDPAERVTARSRRVYHVRPETMPPGVASSDADPATVAASRQLRSWIEVRQAQPGDIVVKQGQPADRFYVIAQGECDVMRDGANGREVLARLGPERYFGETGLLAGVPRTASIVAVTAMRLLSLSRSHFRAAMSGTAPDAAALARLMLDSTA